MKEWAFVNMSNPAKRKSQESQKLIRANGMRHYRKEQRLEADARFESPSIEVDRPVAVHKPAQDGKFYHSPALQSIQAPKTDASLLQQRPDHKTKSLAESNNESDGLLPIKVPGSYLMKFADPKASWGPGLKALCANLPIEGCTQSNSYILHHCEYLLIDKMSVGAHLTNHAFPQSQSSLL